jgi:hypothetical protein
MRGVVPPWPSGRPVSGWYRAAALGCAAAAAALLVAPARGGGGRYVLDGGTAPEQAQVRAALEASSFDWGIIPRQVTIRIARGSGCFGVSGQIFLDANLLDTGKLSWGVIQHELAHQVDFLLLDDADRARLQTVLGGTSWWQSGGLAHGALTSERFASTLAWAYWPVPDNVMRPEASADEAGSIAPAAFRALLARLLPQRQHI